MTPELIAGLAIVVLALVVVGRAVRVIQQSTVGVVQRLGRYQRTIGPGVHLLVPGLDRVRVTVDMKETVLQAEGEMQAAILRAEGSRQAAILNAEADQQANVLRAEGEKQARALRAQGEAEALGTIFATVRDAGIAPSDMLGYKYIETLPEVAAGDANELLLLPTGAADAMGAVAGLGAALREGAAAPEKPEPRRTPPPPTPATSS